MPTLSQQHRMMAVGTPLGEDALVLQAISGREAVNELFEYTLDLLAEDPALDPDRLLGQPVAVRIQGESGARFLHGFVAAVERGGATTSGHVAWRARLVPWPWLLTLGSDFRIFQNMKVPDIVARVFREHGFSDFDDQRLTEDYPEREYVTQYRETHWDFVARLLEQEGISFHFEHAGDRHVLVLTDSPDGFKDAPLAREIPYRPRTASDTSGESIASFTQARELRTAAFALASYDFTKPNTPLQGRRVVPRGYAHAETFERYDFTLGCSEPAHAERYARLAVEAEQSQQTTIRGEADARALAPGTAFKLTDPGSALPADQAVRYAVTEVVTSARQDPYATRSGSGGGGGGGGRGGGAQHYRVAFRAVPAGIPVRPVRTRPDPRALGPETAIVVGAPGEEITTDEHARVKVMFHWDRYAKADDTSSCWIRVSVPSAGRQWGSVFLPRHGEEVIVDFLGGDPDRPVITGRLYNAVTRPPYDLPANKTISGSKSSSSKGGRGFNEIRFEDKKGEEQVYVHAEKNLDVRVKNDAFEWIGHDRHLIVKNDQVEHVEANRSETVDLDHKELIKKDRHLRVQGKECKLVEGQLTLTVEGKVAEVFKADHSESTTGKLYIVADEIAIEAKTHISIHVGSNHISIDKSGITVEAKEPGAAVDVKTASGDITVDAKKNLAMKGAAGAALGSPKTDVKGDGMLTLNGGLVKIN